MGTILSGALIVVGAGFMLLAAVGLVRMPDLFTRMHATTKSTTLGVGCLMLGVAVHFGDLAIAARALAIVAFVFITAPVAGHMVARAAYFSNTARWEGTLSDELQGRYDEKSHILHSHDPEQL
jgi:multicomponent Na+:H+ antiporter subunit G